MPGSVHSMKFSRKYSWSLNHPQWCCSVLDISSLDTNMTLLFLWVSWITGLGPVFKLGSYICKKCYSVFSDLWRENTRTVCVAWPEVLEAPGVSWATGQNKIRTWEMYIFKHWLLINQCSSLFFGPCFFPLTGCKPREFGLISTFYKALGSF